MGTNVTEIVFILDRSGSMQPLTGDTIGGFNSMIENQKGKGEAYVTTVLFDDQYELLHDHMPINRIPLLTNKEYFARGNTALLDAIGKTINVTKARVKAMPKSERPDKVLFIITTDGLENASREFDKSTIREMIGHQQEKHSWTFMFLGANMDAVSEAATIGINTDFARTYTADSAGTQRVWGSVNMAMSSARAADFNINNRESASYMATMSALDQVSEDNEKEKKKPGHKFFGHKNKKN